MGGHVLVTGGAGYIGSHTVKQLLEKGYDVVVLDNLSTGHREAVLVDDANFYQGDIGDEDLVQEIVERHQIDSVIHFAGYSLVGESCHFPEKYFQNNTVNSIRLFTALQRAGVERIIFSSSASVYGVPDQVPIPETAGFHPMSPYGETKLMLEKTLHWMEQAHGMNWVAMRYFNAAGADPSGVIGEHHEPETHLIPLVLKTVLGQRDQCEIYGTDYATPDGTCIRDYVHVNDLAEAHIMALEALRDGMGSQVFNLGSGRGYSVREILNMVREVTGRDFKVVEIDRRPGDPDILIADVSRAEQLLGWKQKHTLRQMIETAWNWHVQHPSGYPAHPLILAP